jgi:hypothetical protein
MMILLVLLLPFLLSACDVKPQVRHYTEVMVDLALPATPEVPTENTVTGQLSWDVPAGWEEVPGGGTMRLATFRLKSDPKAFDCSIVTLPGGAGGLESNLRRWMGQIQLQVPDEQFQRFMVASKNQIFDFSQLQSAKDTTRESMIAAVLDVGGNSVFVKLKGPIAAVRQNKEAFLQLAKSIRVGS